MKTTQQNHPALLHQRFEDLSSQYRFDCSNGITISVRQEYELRLERIREELRGRKTSCYLGEVLKAIGALGEEKLSDALAKQREGGGKKLLGEILVDLGWVHEKTLRRAADIQRIGGINDPGSRSCSQRGSGSTEVIVGETFGRKQGARKGNSRSTWGRKTTGLLRSQEAAGPPTAQT